jgi:hypothetical protein
MIDYQNKCFPATKTGTCLDACVNGLANGSTVGKDCAFTSCVDTTSTTKCSDYCLSNGFTFDDNKKMC